MFASNGGNEKFVVSTAGFPGVYPAAGVTCRSPTSVKAAGEGSDPITAGLPDVGNGFAEVAEVERAYAGGLHTGEALGNGEAGDGANGDGAKGMTFDPYNLPEEDDLDLRFQWVSKEDRIRVCRPQPMASLFRELLRNFPDNGDVGAGYSAPEQHESGDEKAPFNVSREERMDQFFEGISYEDKVRVSRPQPMESLFKELLGKALIYHGPIGCEGAPRNDAPMPGSGNSGAAANSGPGETPTGMGCVEAPSEHGASVAEEEDVRIGSAAPVSGTEPQESPDGRGGRGGGAGGASAEKAEEAGGGHEPCRRACVRI
ncbi:hypothetical protein FGB62_286g04 [Gracilaria domingensis]|nr:hypothetical protein FGB62_286g03 [Gracilaria domingensis]KAI0557577.1 hypothetical protein FGB62_286g02 [Gracilaria domingensis]KAI0557583.1 hypothetical protein FGB62_286g04 [Gracilaria domingensis]